MTPVPGTVADGRRDRHGHRRAARAPCDASPRGCPTPVRASSGRDRAVADHDAGLRALSPEAAALVGQDEACDRKPSSASDGPPSSAGTSPIAPARCRSIPEWTMSGPAAARPRAARRGRERRDLAQPNVIHRRTSEQGAGGRGPAMGSRAGQPLDLSAAAAPSFRLAHSAISPRARVRGVAQEPPHASRIPRAVTSRRGSDTPAPAQATRAAFSAMSPAAGRPRPARPLASARTSVPCPAWQTTASHNGIVRAYDTHSTSRAFGGTSSGRGGGRRLWSRARAPAGPPGPRAPRPASAARRPARSTGDEHERVVARRQLHVAVGPLPHQRARHAHRCGPVPARVLELRERGDDRQLARDPAVKVLERRQPTASRAPVQLFAPLLDSLPHERVGAAATRGRPARARQARADRVGREAGLGGGEDVRRASPTAAPSICAASDAATVGMSATTTSGSNDLISAALSATP